MKSINIVNQNDNLLLTAATVMNMILMSILCLTGSIGVYKENLILVLVWLPLNLLTCFINFHLFVWMSTLRFRIIYVNIIPLMFVLLLNLFYVYLLRKGKDKTNADCIA